MTGWTARLVLSAAVLCFNGPRLAGSDAWAHGTATGQVNTRSEDGSKKEFHATVTVGRGEKQFTVRLEFGRARERGEDEAL